ncbi:MAG: type IV pilus modification PilV family protein [Desulfitobacteriaceae bacterium]
MMTRKDEGMTILEVVMAISILLMGVVFILKSNAVSYHYLAQQELHQQMVFIAVGRIEAALSGQNPDYSSEKPNLVVTNVSALPEDRASLIFVKDDVDYDLNGILIPFGVSVSASNLPDFEMYSYRLADGY